MPFALSTKWFVGLGVNQGLVLSWNWMLWIIRRLDAGGKLDCSASAALPTAQMNQVP